MDQFMAKYSTEKKHNFRSSFQNLDLAFISIFLNNIRQFRGGGGECPYLSLNISNYNQFCSTSYKCNEGISLKASPNSANNQYKMVCGSIWTSHLYYRSLTTAFWSSKYKKPHFAAWLHPFPSRILSLIAPKRERERKSYWNTVFISQCMMMLLR